MNGNTNEKLSSSFTKLSNEIINICSVVISRKTPLYIMLAYIKGGKEDTFLKAAEHKKSRLKKINSTAEIRIKPFSTLTDFKTIWKEIYDITIQENTIFDLYEIHYFGHSDQNTLFLQGSSITYDTVAKLEKLPWHCDFGILVLHSCRSGRYEDNSVNLKAQKGKILNKNCIANIFSSYQKTKVIGQMVYATNTTGDTVEDLKYRNGSFGNKIYVDVLGCNNVALWGYKSKGKVEASYKIDPDYELLKDWQIWPCRLFCNGADFPRTVKKDKFDKNDLTYI